MLIVLRYVDSEKEINERFIKFVLCEGMTGEALAKNIEDTLAELNLPLENCHGQGYDGASAMSSKTKGASGRILTKNPKAFVCPLFQPSVESCCQSMPNSNCSPNVRACTEDRKFFPSFSTRAVAEKENR